MNLTSESSPNNSRHEYDLEDRTEGFAKRVIHLVESLPRNITNLEHGKQLVRSSGSVGANYIEANEAISKKDFVYRIKICRKESKESRYWLRLILCQEAAEAERQELIQEATEIMKIFGAILKKSRN